MVQVHFQKSYMDGFFSKKNETFIAIVYSKRIWLNLLMDDHQFGYIAVFTAKKIG
jgi:hypothetical protein